MDNLLTEALTALSSCVEALRATEREWGKGEIMFAEWSYQANSIRGAERVLSKAKEEAAG